MKRMLFLLVALILVFSMAINASAESTTLTIEVPIPSYTLNVPANQSIDYLASEASIGGITVTNTSGFASRHVLSVGVTYDGCFGCPGNASPIFYSLKCKGIGSDTRYDFNSGSCVNFTANSDGTLRSRPTLPDGTPIDEFIVVIDTSCWDAALGGKYTTTITYTAIVGANLEP